MAIELQDKLYTSAQVADVLGVSLRTLYRYMEDGKIESMKTASGRHRFTKEQILTFLDGGGLDMEQEVEPVRPKPVYERSFEASKPAARVEDYSFNRPAASTRPNGGYNGQENSFGSAQQFNSPKKQDAFTEANFDDFNEDADFGNDDFSFDLRPAEEPDRFNRDTRPSASNDRDSQDFNRPVSTAPVKPESRFGSFDQGRGNFAPSRTPYAPTPVKPSFGDDDFGNRENPVKRPVENVSARGYQSAPRFASQPAQAPARDFGTARNAATEPKISNSSESLNIRYYKSDFNDLIDLAKRVKEASITKDLEYAFTLNAGLSLHFLIDPFTLLHFYVNPEDLQIWRSVLGLVPVANKSEANIGILVNTDVVFIPTKEIGGFKVVEDKVLLKDLMRSSEDNLVKEFRQRILSA